MPRPAGAAHRSALAVLPSPVVLGRKVLCSRRASPLTETARSSAAALRHRLIRRKQVSYEIDFRIIKERARFETVLRHYGLGAQPRRSQYFILCPFHRETDPSCRINGVRNRFRCFGCGAKGSILDFVAR